MKRKYFFGILLSLFLLCGGVFLLTSKNINDNQINQEVTNASNANFHFNKVYGYDTAGVNFTVRIGKCNGEGKNVAKWATRNIKYYDFASGKIDETEDIGGDLFRYRRVEVSSFSSKQDGLEYQHNGYYARFSGSLQYDNGDSSTTIYQNFTGFGQTCGPTAWAAGVSLNFEIYWIVRLTLDENGGSSIDNDVYYSTDNTCLTSSVTLPTRTGYTFQGYYTAKSGGDQWITKNGSVNTAKLHLSSARPKTLYAQWTPNEYSVNINIYSPEGNEEYTTNNNGTFTLRDEDGSVFTELYNEKENKNITFGTSWQIYDIDPGPGMSLNKVTSTGFTQSQSGGTYTFKCTSTSNLVINIYMKWSDFKIDINFYQPNGSTQNGGTFDLYKKLSGGSESLVASGATNEVPGQEYLQYNGQFILKNIMPNAGTYITGASLSSTSDSGTIATSGDPINTITYTANQTGQPSDGWDNAILIYTSTNNVQANFNYNGGKVVRESDSQYYSSNGTRLSKIPPKKDMSRTGYTFKGWSLTPNNTGVYYDSTTDWNDITVTSTNEKGSCSVSDANVGNIEFTLYAIWVANDYDVTLNDGSGAVSNLADMPWIGNAAVSDSTYSYTSGNLKIDYNAKTKDLTLNGTPTNGFILFLNKGLSFKEGDQFKIEITHKSGSMLSWAGNGYFVFEVCDQNGNSFSTNRQYLDLFSINSLAIGSTYSDTLTINANSANLGKGLKVWYYAAGTPASQMITNYEVNFKITKLGDSQNANKKVVATYASPMNVVAVPSKFGHTFNGYFDRASGGTKYYNADGTSARNWDKANTATLYAQWTPYSYTLTLNGNGGTTANDQAVITISDSYTSNLKLQNKPFTRAGYIFKGWSTTQNGNVEYLDGENYSSLITSNNTSITLYAQWQKTIASDIESTYSTAGTYYINTAADLAKLIYTTENKDVGNGYIFIQTANIDLSNLTYLPIGRLNSFSATYDGQGYTISGLRTYNGTDADGNYLETNGGLFANAGGAKIKNVIIEDAEIYGQNAGIIAGSGNASTKISNCVVSGTVNGTNAGSIIGNGNGASISVCLAKGVNTASFAGGSANVDSCIYELADGTKGVSDSFNDYSAWIYPSNFAYPMPKAFMWYPGAELSESSLEGWIDK